MRNLLAKLWADDCGTVTIEYLVLGTFIGLTVVVGVSSLGVAINAELAELANAILAFDQTYSTSGSTTCSAFINGSGGVDQVDNVGFTTSQVTGPSIDVEYCSP